MKLLVRTSRLAAAVALTMPLCTIGCSGDDSDPDPGQDPIREELSSTQAQVIPANGTYQGLFTVPEGVTVELLIHDNYINTQNKWTIAIVQASAVTAFLADQSEPSYGLFAGRGSYSASVSLPADDYALVLICQNIRDSCRFDATVTAVY